MRFLISTWMCLLLVGTSFFSSIAQAIEWERMVSFPRNTTVDDIVQLQDSSYLSVDENRFFGYRAVDGNSINMLTLTHLSTIGDTISMRKSGVHGAWAKMAKSQFSNHVYIGFTQNEDTILNAKMRMMKTDYEGNLVWMYPFIGLEYTYGQVNKIIETPDGGCFAVGRWRSTTPGAIVDGFILKMGPTGILEYMQRINPNGQYTVLYNIEPTADGHYLVSGTSGAAIWSVTIDIFGVPIRSNTWYRQPQGRGIDDCVVLQGDFGTYFYAYGTSSGGIVLNRYWQDTTVHWSKPRAMLGNPPFISNDGGYVRREGISNGPRYFTKYNSDSSINWRINLPSNPLVIFNTMAYDGLGSAVMAGYKQVNNIQNMYYVKIANVGFPVDPVNPRTGTKNREALPNITAYPNPASEYVYLQGIRGKPAVEIYNTKGQRIAVYHMSTLEGIPVYGLKPGMYTWKTVQNGKVVTGKFVRE